MITRSQLAYALEHTTLWTRNGPNETMAQRRYVLYPQLAAVELLGTIQKAGARVMTTHLEPSGPIELDISSAYELSINRPGALHQLTFKLSDHASVTVALTTGELRELASKAQTRLEGE